MNQKKPFFLTTLWVLFGRAGGFLVPFLIAMLMGASPATDAFFFAYAVIFALLNLFAHIFESSLVPFIVEYQEDADRMISFILNALSFGLPVSLLLSLGFAWGMPSLLSFSSSLHPETSALMVRLYLELIPGLFIAILVSAYHGFFYARKLFWFPSFSTLIRTVTMTVVFLCGRGVLGIHSLPLGFFLGEVFRWASAHYLLTQKREVHFLLLSGGFKKISDFFRQAIFQILALTAVSLMPLTDQGGAATLGPGSVSLFNYADRLIQIPYQLFFYGITQVFFSFWSESYQKDGQVLFFGKIEKDMRAVLAGALVLVLLLWLLSGILVRFIFASSHLTASQLNSVTDLFRWLALGFLPGIFRILYGRILMIIKESRIYFFLSWAEIAIKVALNFLLVPLFGIAGLAMATAVVYALTAIFLHLYLKRKSRGYLQQHSKGTS